MQDEPVLRLGKSLVLVGMMGSGKSHTGAILARRLGVPFRDSDSLIEEERGAPISGLFATAGEALFRTWEREKIADILGGPPCVLSTGGGALTTPEVLEDIKARGISIWLNSDTDTLMKRLKRGIAKRPLLSEKDPEGTLRELMDRRKSLYAQADITIDNTHGDIHKAVQDIILAVDAFVTGKENHAHQ